MLDLINPLTPGSETFKQILLCLLPDDFYSSTGVVQWYLRSQWIKCLEYLQSLAKKTKISKKLLGKMTQTTLMLNELVSIITK